MPEREIAIIGTGPFGQELLPLLQKRGCELWTVTSAFRISPGSNLHIEIHDWAKLPELYGDVWSELWTFMQGYKGILYLKEPQALLPHAKAFPAMDICLAWRNLLHLRPMEPDYFVSSIGWLLGLAGVIGREYHLDGSSPVRKVWLVGVGATDSYQHQKANTEALIYALRVRGIQVMLPVSSPLCKAALYEYSPVPVSLGMLNPTVPI